jgi:hypothetical protein
VVEEQRPPGGGTDVCWGGRGVGHGVGAGVPEEGEEAAGGGGGGSYFEGWREARLTVSRLLGDRWRVRLTGMLETSVRTDKMNPSQLTLCRLKDPNWRSVILGWKSIYAVRCHDVVDTRLLPTPPHLIRQIWSSVTCTYVLQAEGSYSICQLNSGYLSAASTP